MAHSSISGDDAAAARGGSALRIAMAGALVLSAMLFAVGVHAEQANHRERSPRASQEVSNHTDSGETAGATSAESAVPNATAPEATEHVLGVNTESNTIVALVIIVSVLLAAGMLLRLSGLLWVVAGFAVAAAIFDVAEIFHQISRSDSGLAALAALIAALHFGVAALGVGIQRRSHLFSTVMRVRARQ